MTSLLAVEHFADDLLEQYLFGNLVDEGEFEEHILACNVCVSRLETLEKEIGLLKQALIARESLSSSIAVFA